MAIFLDKNLEVEETSYYHRKENSKFNAYFRRYRTPINNCSW